MRCSGRCAVEHGDVGPGARFTWGTGSATSRVMDDLPRARLQQGRLVLHMLRRMLGDDVFFRSLRRFYADRFQKAGTEELRKAFEEESGRSLETFFDGWIYGSDLPRTVTSRVDGSGSGQAAVVHLEQPPRTRSSSR